MCGNHQIPTSRKAKLGSNRPYLRPMGSKPSGFNHQLFLRPDACLLWACLPVQEQPCFNMFFFRICLIKLIKSVHRNHLEMKTNLFNGPWASRPAENVSFELFPFFGQAKPAVAIEKLAGTLENKPPMYHESTILISIPKIYSFNNLLGSFKAKPPDKSVQPDFFVQF